MKLNRHSLTGLFIAALLVTSITGCRDKNIQERTYTANVPVYMDFDEFRSSVSSDAGHGITNAGKVFFKDNFLFINNREDGIHVIDNRDPGSPVNLAYINIPGNRELAISGNTLFADSYTDLVIIDVTDPTNAVEIGRETGVFPQVLPQHDPNYRVQQPDINAGVVVGWELQTISEVVENGHSQDGFIDLRWDDAAFMSQEDQNMADDRASFGIDQSQVRSAISGGKSGSMAGFVLHGSYLYALSGNDILVFKATASSVTKMATLNTDRNVETLFPFGENLFVGTSNGMLIYSLSNPANPNYLSTFEHAESCDPVAVNGNYAYVTLRSGRDCGGWSNQLDVIDVSDLSNPKLLHTEQMTSPYGLAIDDGSLFVCEGYNGLKVYDVSNPELPAEIGSLTGNSAMDAITYNGVLMTVGQDGLHQYSFDDVENIAHLSTIHTK